MPKCSCGVVSGDCYDACGARESKISSLIAERDAAVALLRRYRNETPLGHQPHMIAHEVDALLDARKEGA